MQTNWGEFVKFINSLDEGSTITRKQLHSKLASWGFPSTSVDGYRSLLSQAKFLESAGRGKYKIKCHLPEGQTMTELFYLLRGDNLSYIEAIQNRKDNKILQNAYLKERHPILSKAFDEAGQLLRTIQSLPCKKYGIEYGHLVQQIKQWNIELEKDARPTKTWLKENKINE